MAYLIDRRLEDQSSAAWLDHKAPAEQRSIVHLSQGWHFRQADDPESVFLDAQGFPTEIHLDLLHHGIIPDPFIGKQENDVQWVGESPWTYRTKFYSPTKLTPDSSQKIVLVFEGLDTYATVVLNGETIWRAENMFLPFRFDVTDKLLRGKENVLEIMFDSTFLVGKKLVEKHSNHRWGCWNGDPSRLAVRKAQYHYGWDWGPTLLTCGPWKPIFLETYRSRISDLFFRTELSDSLDSATVIAKLDFEGQADHVKFELSIDGSYVASVTETLCSSHTAEAAMRTNKPKLWYPHSYGNQPLYVLTATLSANINGFDAILDTTSKRFGLRKAKVVQRKLKDAPGTTFMFEINNIPLFCGGSNWIPAHSFQTLLDPKKYRDWIQVAVDGNQVMLRVWGGGIYENDAFYEACDAMGVLVWQDFLFACGNYPAADLDFVKSVEKEAIANVKRLRHHPCIVVWAGNNEDYQYCESEDLDYDPEDQNPEHWLRGTFPARYIYEKTLNNVVSELVPDTYYHFGSPFGGKDTTDPTVGDIHQWNVWHGTQEKYQDFDRLSGRFVSEFGMEAYPDLTTVNKFLLNGQNDEDRYPQSSTVEFHNKAAGHERRLALYLAENIRYDLRPFEQYVYCTQLVQAEAVGTAYCLWKRQWKGPGREYCAGALVWQLNDCWPAISWSIVDHYLRPKLAYFAVKREMEPLTIGMKRTVRTIPADKYTRAYIKTIHELEVWACNLTLEDKTVTLRFKQYTFQPPPPSSSNANQNLEEKQQATPNSTPHFNTTTTTTTAPTTLLPANRTTELSKHIIHTPPSSASESLESQTIIQAILTSPQPPHNTLAHAISWPQPLKHIHLAKPTNFHLKLSMTNHDQVHDQTALPIRPNAKEPEWWRVPNKVSMLLLRSDVPLKGVKVEVERNGDREGEEEEEGGVAVLEDQGFDVMDHQTVSVRVWGVGVGEEGRVKVRYLGM